MSKKISVVPLCEKNEKDFYQIVEEYLPDSNLEKVKMYAGLFPNAFLVLLCENEVIGVAFGWDRKIEFPEDDSFVLNGIAVHSDWQKNGYGKQLLKAFEAAAEEYGESVVSLGSAGGDVEKFYIDCGYLPMEYKYWENGGPVVEKSFEGSEEYYSYVRKNKDGFVVMYKNL